MIRNKLIVFGVVLAGITAQPQVGAMDVAVSGFGSYFDADKTGDAWGGGVMGRLGIFDWLAVDARASYFDLSDSNLEMIPLEAAALFRLPLMDDALVPYAGVGVGYYMFTDSDLVEVDNNVGFFPMAGLEYRFGAEKQWSVFGEARWLFIASDVDAANSMLSNLNSDDISGLGINFGLSYSF